MHHTSGYFQNVQTDTALTQIAALAGSADNPRNSNHTYKEPLDLLGVWAGSILLTRAQLIIPSLRFVANHEIRPVNVGVEPLSPLPIQDLRNSPIPLQANEEIRLNMTDATVGAVDHWGLLFVGKPIFTIPKGPLYTLRATGTTTLVDSAWTNVPLTFADTLPRGVFAVLGLDAVSAGGIGARLVIPGQYWRPGCVAYDTAAEIPYNMFNPGGLGVWGTFGNEYLPSVEFLSLSADTAETVNIHTVKIA